MNREDDEGHEPAASRRDVARVELVLVGTALDSATVTASVGLQPSRAWKKGDTYASRSGQEITRWRGLWAITCSSENVDVAAAELLTIVEPVKHLIVQAAAEAGATAGISIWWDPAAHQGGFTIPSDLLLRAWERESYMIHLCDSGGGGCDGGGIAVQFGVSWLLRLALDAPFSSSRSARRGASRAG